MEWLPTAVRDPHGRVLNWTERTDPKGCLHTTEGVSWPGYRDWTTHPHATVRAIRNRGIEIRQHVPFSRASFSLRNANGGAETNRDYVFQFELIGTCERNGDAFKAGAYYWPDADDSVLIALYFRLIKPVSDALGVPLVSLLFQSYPASYGARGRSNTVRLSGGQFDNYSGWLGHQHVPENDHGDPGSFPWDRMMRLTRPRPPEKLSTEDEEMLAYYDPKEDTDGSGPDSAEAFVITGEKLRHISGAEVSAIRNAGGTVRFIPIPASDSLWKLARL